MKLVYVEQPIISKTEKGEPIKRAVPDLTVYGVPKFQVGLEFEAGPAISGSLKRWGFAVEPKSAEASRPQGLSSRVSAALKPKSLGGGKASDDEAKG